MSSSDLLGLCSRHNTHTQGSEGSIMENSLPHCSHCATQRNKWILQKQHSWFNNEPSQCSDQYFYAFGLTNTYCSLPLNSIFAPFRPTRQARQVATTVHLQMKNNQITYPSTTDNPFLVFTKASTLNPTFMTLWLHTQTSKHAHTDIQTRAHMPHKCMCVQPNNECITCNGKCSPWNNSSVDRCSCSIC